LTIRRLGPGDEEIVIELGAETPLTHAQAAELLSDGRTVYLVAFEDREPIGYVFAHELRRRHGDPSDLFVYDLEVIEPAHRRGIATALVHELEQICHGRGIRTGFALTNASNDSAMSFYRSLGALRPNEDDVMWEFDYRA
jgi:ribosomal protein S18 acetylase RimI-like enzyme